MKPSIIHMSHDAIYDLLGAVPQVRWLLETEPLAEQTFGRASEYMYVASVLLRFLDRSSSGHGCGRLNGT
jgi:hypothetical protein